MSLHILQAINWQADNNKLILERPESRDLLHIFPDIIQQPLKETAIDIHFSAVKSIGNYHKVDNLCNENKSN